MFPVKYTKKGKPSTAHRRRSRGYGFEKNKIVKFFEEYHITHKDWDEYNRFHARRLGGSSTGLPDVVVTNPKLSIMFAIEAKSTFQDKAYIKHDQIVRCYDTTEFFGAFEKRSVVFAFKFSKNVEEGRLKLREYYYKIGNVRQKMICESIEWVKCDYDGNVHYKLKKDENNKPILGLKLVLKKYRNLEDLALGRIQKELPIATTTTDHQE